MDVLKLEMRPYVANRTSKLRLQKISRSTCGRFFSCDRKGVMKLVIKILCWVAGVGAACWTYAKTEPVRIADATESEGSYPRQECVAKNPDKSEEEYQAYLTELGRYREWPRDPNYDIGIYNQTECEYHGGLRYDFEAEEFHCIIPLQFQTASNGDEMYQNALDGFEYYKSWHPNTAVKTIDYSKE